MHVLHIFGVFNINATAFSKGQYSLHLLLLKSSYGRRKSKNDRPKVPRNSSPRRQERHLKGVGVRVEGVEALGVDGAHQREDASLKL